MSVSFDSVPPDLEGRALCQALERLSVLGLIGNEIGAARAKLARLIYEAIQRGERDQENLILYAMGRFQADRPAEES
jgi:hypothetical protein